MLQPSSLIPACETATIEAQFDHIIYELLGRYPEDDDEDALLLSLRRHFGQSLDVHCLLTLDTATLDLMTFSEDGTERTMYGGDKDLIKLLAGFFHWKQNLHEPIADWTNVTYEEFLSYHIYEHRHFMKPEYLPAIPATLTLKDEAKFEADTREVEVNKDYLPARKKENIPATPAGTRVFARQKKIPATPDDTHVLTRKQKSSNVPCKALPTDSGKVQMSKEDQAIIRRASDEGTSAPPAGKPAPRSACKLVQLLSGQDDDNPLDDTPSTLSVFQARTSTGTAATEGTGSSKSMRTVDKPLHPGASLNMMHRKKGLEPIGGERDPIIKFLRVSSQESDPGTESNRTKTKVTVDDEGDDPDKTKSQDLEDKLENAEIAKEEQATEGDVLVPTDSHYPENLKPSDPIGRTHLVERLRAKAVKTLQDHESDGEKNPTRIKFKVRMRDDGFEDLRTYSETLQYIEDDEQADPILRRFKRILSYQGSLKPNLRPIYLHGPEHTALCAYLHCEGVLNPVFLTPDTGAPAHPALSQRITNLSNIVVQVANGLQNMDSTYYSARHTDSTYHIASQPNLHANTPYRQYRHSSPTSSLKEQTHQTKNTFSS